MSDNEKRAFHGAQCLSYPNCTGGCGLGCTHDVEASRPTTDNEMLKLAERIESLKPNRLAADNGAATFIYPNDVKAIVSALRAAAASAEPAAREAVAACLDCLKLETYRPDDDSADYAVTIVGHSKAVDAIMALYTNPAPGAEIVAALEEIRREAAAANEVIRLKRGKEGQGFVRIATALHRIEQIAKAKGGVIE